MVILRSIFSEFLLLETVPYQVLLEGAPRTADCQQVPAPEHQHQQATRLATHLKHFQVVMLLQSWIRGVENLL